VHPFQDGFASLILHPRRQSQESNVRFGHHFTDLQFGRDRIPDQDRLEKAGGLFDKRNYGPFQHRRKRGSAYCGQCREEQPMGDAFPKAGGLGLFVIVVDGVLIARQPGEAHKVCISQRLGRNMKCVADVKIFKISG
jgi:hypothetical protein